MILSDRDIRAEIEAGRIVIDPYGPESVQPSSVDVHLASKFRVFENQRPGDWLVYNADEFRYGNYFRRLGTRFAGLFGYRF